MKLDDLLEVLKAAKAGADIQMQNFSHNSGWIDMPDPKSFDWSGATYRVRPDE